MPAARPLPPLFWVFWWGSIVNRLGTLVVPYLTFYLTRERGLTPTEAGMIVALYGLGAALAGVVGGQLADRWGRRPTALLGLVGGAVLVLALSAARSVPAVAVGVFALGAVAEMFRPAVNAAIADIVPAEDRARAFGLQYWAVNLGFAIAAISGGFLARLGYEVLFAVDAATTLLYAVLIFRRVPETRPAVAEARAESGEPAPGGVLSDRVFLVFLLLSFSVGFLFMQSGATMASDMGARGYDESGYGLVMAINGLLIVGLQPSMTALVTALRPAPDGSNAARFDPSRVMSLSAVLVGGGFGLYVFGTVAGYGVGIVVWTLGEIIMAPVNAGVVAAIAPVAHRGRYQGAWNMSHGVASCLGPLIGTWLLSDLGAGPLWIGCAALGAAASVGYLGLEPALRRRLRQSEQTGST